MRVKKTEGIGEEFRSLKRGNGIEKATNTVEKEKQLMSQSPDS